jgi:cysteinyl-tRNA synthetase
MLVSEVVKRARPIELRYYLVAAHYRSIIEFSFESLAEAGAGFRRVEGFVDRAIELIGHIEPSRDLPAAFVAAMDDDLAVPAALAVVHETVRRGNAAVAAADKAATQTALAAVRGMLAILGLDPYDEVWLPGRETSVAGRSVIDRLVADLLEQREEARARRDFAAADAVRDQLRAAGVEVEDTPAGPRWSVTS